LLPLVDSLKDQPELLAALTVLLASNAPVLSSAEQLTLNVMALESLLLPEVRTGLSATFARRVSALLAASQEHAASLKETARGLYDARSARLHGEAPRSAEDSMSAAAQGHAQQRLAASIRRLAENTKSKLSLSEQRTQLDKPLVEFKRQKAELPLTKPTELCQQERLLKVSFADGRHRGVGSKYVRTKRVHYQLVAAYWTRGRRHFSSPSGQGWPVHHASEWRRTGEHGGTRHAS
jgi:hypothetical protein